MSLSPVHRRVLRSPVGLEITPTQPSQVGGGQGGGDVGRAESNRDVAICMPYEFQDEGAIVYRAGAYTWDNISPRLVSTASPMQAAAYGISMQSSIK